MDLQTVVSVLMTEQKPEEDEQLTARAAEYRERAKKLTDEDACLTAFMLLSLAARFRAPEVYISCSDRKLNFRFEGAQRIPVDFWSSDELLGWFWLLISQDCKAWLATMSEGTVHLLGWDGKRVVRNSGPAPSEIRGALEFQASLAQLQSPVFNAMGDKKILDGIKEGFVERARVYPLPVYFNGVLWEYPLDIKLERTCSFTSYSLVSREDDEIGFAVGQPWAHGCRYWLTRDGKIIDMVSKGASDVQNVSGNICYIPALKDNFNVQRRLNILRKRDEPCIELSPVRSMWGKTSFLPGFEEFLLSPRTAVFGQTPVIRLQTRPLRCRQLLMQTDQVHEASVIVPVKDGLTLDPIFIVSKPGGLHALALVPDHLAVGRQGRKLAEQDAANRWARDLCQQAQVLQKPLTE